MAKFDLIIRGGRVIDPAQDIDGVRDVAVKNGTIAQVAPRIAGTAPRTLDARNNLVVPGMIDTHSHIYQHVTGDFGMNPDEVGLRSGVTAVVDQGGVAPLTIGGDIHGYTIRRRDENRVLGRGRSEVSRVS